MKHYSGALNKSPGWEIGNFYKIIRLKTGEILLFECETDIHTVATEIYIEMIRPCMRMAVSGNNIGPNVLNESYGLVPWIGGSSSTEFTIPAEIVLTIGDMDRKQISEYKAYCAIIDLRNERIKDRMEQDIIDTEIVMLLAGISQTGTVEFVDEESIPKEYNTDIVPNISPPKIDGNKNE